MEFERRGRSSGVAKGGLTTGIIGTALGGLNSLALMGAGVNAATRSTDNVVWGNGWNNSWFGNSWGWGPGFMPYGTTPQTVVVNTNEESNRSGRYSENGCSENMLVNRYELSLQQQLAEKDSQIALRDANTYNDQKMLEMYKYVDGRFQEFERELARQAVVNQKTEDSFALVKQDVDCCCKRLETQICNEARERRCSDNQIITYTNATFYPKQVADVTVGSATTPQTTYNPLPQNTGCCCNNNN